MKNFKKGQSFPSEKAVMKDRGTGATIWQMTNYAANHSNIYFTKNSFTPDDEKIVFLSQRNGWTNLYTAHVETGEIMQLTDYAEDVGLLSPCISHDGALVYYVVGNSIRRISLSNLEEEIIVRFPGQYPGNLHLSSDGEFIVSRISPGGGGIKGSARKVLQDLSHPLCRNALMSLIKDTCELACKSFTRLIARRKYDVVIIFLNELRINKILETNRSGITLISPDNQHILCHMYERELWYTTLDGRHNRPLYGQDKTKWVTHPNWLNNNEVIFIEWPYGLKAVSLDGRVRTICELNVRHPSVSKDRKSIICDTTHPDRGLFLINANNGRKKRICYPDASLQKQWERSRPPRFLPFVPSFIYDPFGSEWVHTHASFSHDGKKIIFNSDRGNRYSQIYIVLLDQ